MPVRLSGMVPGMDTESLVSALVSSYSVKKDNLVKAQTKVSWKQEKWKTMNTSIYKFYSGKLSSARFSSNFSLKTSKVSNSNYASVTASSSAVAGTQSLKVKQLAATGYLTGGEITLADGGKVTGSSKLSDVTGLDSGSINIKVGDKSSTINITEDMTVNQFVAKLKDAGLNANFDENNKRFFISSKTSGKDNDFSLTAGDTNGLNSLKSLGIFVAEADSAENAEYSRLAGLVEGSDEYNAELESMYSKVTAKSVATTYANRYNSASEALGKIKDNELWQEGDTAETAKLRRDSMLDAYSSYYKPKLDDEGNEVKNDEGETVYEYDTEAMKEAGVYEDYTKAVKDKESLSSLIDSYEENTKILGNAADYVSLSDNGDGTYTAKANEANQKVLDEVDKTNADSYATAKAALDDKIAIAKAAGSTISNGAVRIKGQDSEIELNGAKFTNNTNNYSINGLTIQALAETGNEEVSITTDTDVDGIYDMIKDMFKEYNELIKSMDVAYNASSAKGYEPLTSEEKEAMSEDEAKKWEDKIKDSLLRKDTTLGTIMNSMKTIMMSSFKVDGKDYSLASFGINTLGYFSSPENETGVFHIDGDKDDSHTSANTDKLREMIANDPDTVISFMSQLSTKLYTDLGNKMASSSVSSAYTVYNDKQMSTQYSEYNTKIKDAESQVTKWEDYYYKKFSAMETAMAQLNSQTSSLTGLFGNS